MKGTEEESSKPKTKVKFSRFKSFLEGLSTIFSSEITCGYFFSIISSHILYTYKDIKNIRTKETNPPKRVVCLYLFL